MKPLHIIDSWGKVLSGKVPMLSIEITRECPLRCPGCYAYGDAHLGENGPNLRTLSDYRGDELVAGILRLVDEHKPLQLSLVGGEPLMRHRELNEVLPQLMRRNVYTLIVTSGVIPIPNEWRTYNNLTIAVSIDGNPEDHDVRRKPATYERILRNIGTHRFNVHWTVVRSNVEQPGYMDRYLGFWNAHPGVKNIWVSMYTPQVDEQSAERLTPRNRADLAAFLRQAKTRYPKLTMHGGLVDAFLRPPETPDACAFSKLSANYTADLKTRVEPCVFGGTPLCSECGCSISLGMHWLDQLRIAGPLRAGHLIDASLGVGRVVNRVLRSGREFRTAEQTQSRGDLVQIKP